MNNRTTPQSLKRSVRVLAARLVLGLSITAGTAVAVSPHAQADAPSFSDPIANIASEALKSIGGRDTPVVLAGPPAKGPANTVSAGVVVPTTVEVVPTASLTQSITASISVAAPAPSAAVAAQAAPAPGPAGSSWSSVVLDTESVGAYFTGTPVEDAATPEVTAVIAALPSDPGARYTATLQQLADLVASRTKVRADALMKVWQSTDERRMKAILIAMSQVGTRYRWTGNQPGGFDCSGLTSYAWAQAGVKIPRTSSEQVSKLTARSFDQLQPGDLIYRPGHIGMYLGVGDAMVHAPQTGKTVEVKKIGKSTRYVSPL